MIKVTCSLEEFETVTGRDPGDDWYNSNLIPKLMLEAKREEVIQAYVKATGMTREEIETDFECGINDWIGFGSVTCCELPCYTLVGYEDQDAVLMLV